MKKLEYIAIKHWYEPYGRAIYQIEHVEGDYGYNYKLLGRTKTLYTELYSGEGWIAAKDSYVTLAHRYNFYNTAEELADEIFIY